MSKTSILRYIGNFLLLLGYQIMLWGDFKNGLMIKFIGGLLGIPFAIKLKLCVIFNRILWYYRDIKVNPTFLGFIKPSGGVKYDPI